MFPDRLRELRVSNHLTQKDIAQRLNLARNTITNWEKGVYDPNINNIVELSKIFGTTTDYLLTGKSSNNQKSKIENAFQKIVIKNNLTDKETEILQDNVMHYISFQNSTIQKLKKVKYDDNSKTDLLD